MAYDAGLAARIDDICADWAHLTRKRMFGGVCYLHSGNMAFGVWKDFLIVRCGPGKYAHYLNQPHARVFDVTGKPMSGWVMVGGQGIEEDQTLQAWLEVGRAFAGSLPPKPGY